MYSPPWPHLPLKRLFHIIGGSTPSSNVDAYWDGDVPWYTPADFPGNGSATLPPSSRRISEEGLANSSATVQPAGSLLLATRAPIGPVGILPENAAFNQGCKCLKAKIPLNERYFYYCLSTQGAALNALGRGSTFMELSAESLGAFKVPVPSREAQDQVVRFLDRETAEIDALIEKQERLIALLEEKRQAFISEAVTKGLDPTAPMKDSGIPWLGKVPQHWQVSPVKRLISILTDYTANGSFASLAENVEYFESGYARLVRLTDLRCNLENEGLYVSESAYEFLGKSKLFGGELLFANVGANAGYVCLMPDGHGACTLGPNMYLIRFKDNVTSNAYMERVLTSDVCRSHLDVAMTSTAQPKLSKDDVKELFVAIPQSTQEQAHILDTLSKHGSEIDDVRDASRRQILLLQERRSALISSAVTGKVDVTGRV